ncbi:hypothetical protein EDD22DRAFT_891378, partial [Suillus occidentalis]
MKTTVLWAACSLLHHRSARQIFGIAMFIEWLDDIMPSDFWVKFKDYAGAATQGTVKVSPPRMPRGFTSVACFSTAQHS